MTQINWSEMSDKDKIGLLIEKIMGWPCFESWELMVGRDNQDECPVAFWNDQYDPGWFVFFKANENAKRFDPLHSLDDAWLIIEHIKPGRNNDAQMFHIRSRFANALDTPRLWSYPAKEVCNIICLAALRAHGIEVQS